MAGLRSVLFTSLWIFSLAGEEHRKVTVNPGEDVPLQCQASINAEIILVKWSRPDLKSNKYVFFLRENRPYEKYQLPSYRGRVNLSDPEMKDGNVSVVLKNVSVYDTGTYECRVIISEGEESKLYSTIQLNVSVSGHTDGDTGGGRDTDGNLWGVVGVVVGGLFGVVVVVVVGWMIITLLSRSRKHKSRCRGVKGGGIHSPSKSDPFSF